MKIVTYRHHNPELEIIEIYGELTGRGALRLADLLYTSLDKGTRYMIIDLAHVKKADGLVISNLEYFINRGLTIRLFNVELEILSLLSLSGKSGVIKTYSCRERDEAILLIEKEIREKKYVVDNDVKKRRYPRINTSFQAKLKCPAVDNSEIIYKAVIQNLSEGGVLTGQITAFNGENGKQLRNHQMPGKELSEITFSLNGDSHLIKTNGECVWKNSEQPYQCAGIRLKYLSKVYKDRVREYICENL